MKLRWNRIAATAIVASSAVYASLTLPASASAPADLPVVSLPKVYPTHPFGPDLLPIEFNRAAPMWLYGSTFVAPVWLHDRNQGGSPAGSYGVAIYHVVRDNNHNKWVKQEQLHFRMADTPYGIPYTTSPLAPKADKWIPGFIDLPAEYAGQTILIQAVVDAFGNVPEINEDNNDSGVIEMTVGVGK